MASLKTIRKRIGSVKNTQKITKAMKMVAAVKLRRAQQAVMKGRAFAKALKNIIAALGTAGEGGRAIGQAVNPKKAIFLIFTSNHGLCGGFNSNLLRKTELYLKTKMTAYEVIDIRMVGKKGREFYKARGRSLKDVFVEYAESFSFEEATEFGKKLMQELNDGAYDESYLVYNQFKSALVQETQILKLLPIAMDEAAPATESVDASWMIFEPSKKALIEQIIPRYVATRLYQAHLDSIASELGARMTAMESATKNAREMIGLLTLQYNRARQAAITKELMDIVNGTESLK